jgi:hypothetical protein
VRLGAAVALFAVSVAVGATVAGGDADRGYSRRERTAFVAACAAKGMERGRCDCMFAFIARRVPHDEFAEADRTRDPEHWPARMRRVTAEGLRRCDPEAPSEEAAQVLQLRL